MGTAAIVNQKLYFHTYLCIVIVFGNSKEVSIIEIVNILRTFIYRFCVHISIIVLSDG